MEIGSLKRNSAAVSSGQWIGDIPGMGDVQFKVRGFSSPMAIAYRSRKERSAPRSDRNRDGTLKPEASVRVISELLAEVVLLDWSGITDGGEPVLYSAELAMEWLTDPDMVFFADGVAWAAQVVDRGSAEMREDLEKN
jgi:hypothetical protein